MKSFIVTALSASYAAASYQIENYDTFGMGVLSAGPEFIEEVNPEQRAALRAWTLDGNMQ